MLTVVVLAALLPMLTACEAAPQSGVASKAVVKPGRGMFTFDGYPPLADHPVRVFYDAPADPSTAEILIVMHGVGRNAEEYRADWEQLLADRNVIVVVPEFSDADYPGSASYNAGNVVDQNGRPQPREQWTFNVIEALFDFIVRDVHSRAEDYALFGHSAGAQFVHRFVEFMPENRARVAVAANAGWYTMPDDSVPFPYGLRGAPAQQRDLGPAFGANLIVLLGANDTDPGDDSLRHDERSDQQGRHRLERGQNFYRVARDVAADESLPFRWRLQLMPGVAHSHTEAAAAAQLLLFDQH
jgi:poly(3-hydroxybutyrate) depolymerase